MKNMPDVEVKDGNNFGYKTEEWRRGGFLGMNEKL